MTELLKDQLLNLPSEPGIYQFKDKNGKIIYIGKARSLKSRVKSYFHSNQESPKTRVLVEKISSLEYIVTDSEIEALVLENNLIKQYKPRYNILLKDDKSFPFIRVTKEPYPRIFVTREIIRDGSLYFGPFTEVKSMKSSLRMISHLFRIRSCNLPLADPAIAAGKFKVCLDYHIKKCDGPCEGFISAENYRKLVEQAVKVFRGKTEEVIREIEDKMEEAADLLNFELAASLRDKLEELKVYSEKQKVVYSDKEDRDIIAAVNEDKDVACSVLNIRGGKLISKKQLSLYTETPEDPASIYASVLKYYYGEFTDIPGEIILENEPSDSDVILKWLENKAARKIRLVIPRKKSEASSLLNMSRQNAIYILKDIQIQKMKKEGNSPHVLSALKRDLRLSKLPVKIECFDISNLQGTDSVASMVVFVNGKPKKSLYRKFIIKTVEGPDDFASMQEVIRRRYSKVLENPEDMPDLIMVDGGKGQLSSAVEILNSIGLKSYQIIGLAKRLEEVFLPEIPEAQTIPKTSGSLKLLQQVRDEAHRFAITFHRERRDKRILYTELTDIPGIGKLTAEKLLKEFGSIEMIKKTSGFELEKKVGKRTAGILAEYFKNSNSI